MKSLEQGKEAAWLRSEFPSSWETGMKEERGAEANQGSFQLKGKK